ncbi:hypothetical protein C9E81_00015 [Paracoccus alkanivorans]|uniref:Uncharacterized protein n=1 Tax=Paracoccus alkanivorans TaxID=2116655 RepID=A0A3M0MHH4_9RHOB|nr:hypothetical protein C9E81_00015 [Paracoccus alkanivorans]
MWAAVLLAVIEDYRREYWGATERSSYPRPEGVISDLRYYFASRGGRMVRTMAGFDDLCVELVIERIRAFKPGRQDAAPRRSPVMLIQASSVIQGG